MLDINFPQLPQNSRPPSRRSAGRLGWLCVSLLSLGLGGCSMLGRAAMLESELPSTANPLESGQALGESGQAFGVLEVRANGEDFVRQGFTAKDGWEITFDHLYLSLADVVALQTQPPFDPDSEQAPQIQVKAEQLPVADVAQGSAQQSFPPASTSTASPSISTTVVDLADAETPTALVVQFPQAKAGRYNALGWSVKPALAGPSAGQSLRLMGQASRGDETIAFTVDWDASYRYLCGDFIGDQRKGILKGGDRADLEATFHFDHVFGDGDTPLEDDLNQAALGFAPLAAIATDGQLTTNRGLLQTQLAPADFKLLDEAMAGLAHVGEGHCRQVSVEPSLTSSDSLSQEEVTQ